MQVAFGLKAHSGWAALVVIGAQDRDLQVLERQRLELVDKGQEWAKQPYHAAERLSSGKARKIVERGIESAHRKALHEIRRAVKPFRNAGQQVVACALLVGDPMPDWSVDEILAVHFRMHKAEGVLFRNALARAAEQIGLNLVTIPEKLLLEHATASLSISPKDLNRKLVALGKSVGPPWAKDQKEATLAAMIALQGHS